MHGIIYRHIGQTGLGWIDGQKSPVFRRGKSGNPIVLPAKRRRKPAGIDTKRNYVTVTLCVLQTVLKEIIVDYQNYATLLHCRLQNDDNGVKQPWGTEGRR